MTIRASLLVPAIMLFGLSLTACGASMPSALTPPARQGPVSGVESGRIPAGQELTPFAAGHAALEKLDPRLLRAVQKAATAAKADGITILISSAWRSAHYQKQLFSEARTRYGSDNKAAQYVLPPHKSAHVRGEAVDIAPTDADDWLNRHGSRYGLCQIYANEIWHFELATRPGTPCPRQLRNATDDRALPG